MPFFSSLRNVYFSRQHPGTGSRRSGAGWLAGLLAFGLAGPAVASPTNAFQPALTLTGEFWHNAAGGVATGSQWNTLADLTLACDLARLGGPAGGRLVAQLQWVENQRHGPGLGAHTGAFNPVSGLMAADHLRCFNLYYRQTWAGERCTLKLGQLALDDDFMGSDYASLFANSAFGAMPSQVATPVAACHDSQAAFPIYAVAAPGVWCSARVSDHLSLQTGFYHGGPGPDESHNYGFDWETGSGIGPVWFYEGACQLAFAGRPSTVRLGGAYHFGRFDDLAALKAGTAAEVRGLYSFYVIQDLVLLQLEPDQPQLAAFWRVGLSPQQDRSIVHAYADAGFSWFGPIPGRAADVAGLAVSCTQFGHAYRACPGADALASAETTVELTYRAQLTATFAVQVDVQRLYRPAPDATGHRHPATTLGLRVEVSL